MLIQKNPLTMLGTISPCWLFCYRTPVRDAERLLPPQLQPVELNGHAFWNVVVCRVQGMRPKSLPVPVGFKYWHVAYRLYVSLRTQQGGTIEGLYFLRSDCDSLVVSLAGNILTDFNFHTATVRVLDNGDLVRIQIASRDNEAHATIDRSKSPSLAPGSLFGSLDEASRFLKYKPNGISIGSSGLANVVHILRDENAWQSKCVHVEEALWPFFSDKEVAFEICYEVAPIDYQWLRAKSYQCESS
jgi:hypothetical protein